MALAKNSGPLGTRQRRGSGIGRARGAVTVQNVRRKQMNKNNIIEVKVTKYYKSFLVEAVTHVTLFSHCANGAISASIDYFENTVEPLLMIHGVVVHKVTEDEV